MDLKNTVIMSSSCVNHGFQLAQQLKADFCRLPSMFVPWYKENIIMVGAFHSDLFKVRELLNYGKKVILLFVGSDVVDLQNDYKGAKSNIELANLCHKVLCVSEQLKDELGELGVKSETITLVPDGRDIELEEDRRGILCYLPVAIPFKYRLFRTPIVKEIAKLLPEYTFYACGDTTNCMLPNWESVGYLNGEEENDIIKKCVFNLRITSHDGFSQQLITMAQNKIPTIVEYSDAPYMIKVDFEKEEEIPGKVVEIVKGYDGSNVEEMSNYYKTEYSVERMVSKFKNL